MSDNYRAIGLLNHSYKVLSICVLNRLLKEIPNFLSDWQAGSRQHRGCRDNILLLRVIYDNIIRGKTNCVVTYIDFAAAFDSVSHKYRCIDSTLARAGASRKTRALFRAIYEEAQGTARTQGLDGTKVYSRKFDINRGSIQEDIISPIVFRRFFRHRTGPAGTIERRRPRYRRGQHQKTQGPWLRG